MNSGESFLTRLPFTESFLGPQNSQQTNIPSQRPESQECCSNAGVSPCGSKGPEANPDDGDYTPLFLANHRKKLELVTVVKEFGAARWAIFCELLDGHCRLPHGPLGHRPFDIVHSAGTNSNDSRLHRVADEILRVEDRVFKVQVVFDDTVLKRVPFLLTRGGRLLDIVDVRLKHSPFGFLH